MYEKQTRYRNKNRIRINKNLRIYQKKKRRFVAEMKNKPCMDCGGWFHPVQMDFDHRPGEIKAFGIGTSYCLKFLRVYKEILKCDLVCANCHRLRTYRRNQHGADGKTIIHREYDRNIV